MRSLLLIFLLAFGAITAAPAFPQYYDIADRDKAQAEARDRHLPLAWFGGFVSQLTETNPPPGEQADLSQMAMADLQGQAVVVFFEGSNMGPVPGIVHAQDHIADDGPLPGGAAWDAPKIVFTNSEVTRILGRISHTQLKAEGKSALDNLLQKISQDPAALAPDAAPASPVPAPSPPPVPQTPAPASSALQSFFAPPASVRSASSSPAPDSTASAPDAGLTADEGDDDMSPDEIRLWNWCRQNGVYVALGIAVLLVLLRAVSKEPAA